MMAVVPVLELRRGLAADGGSPRMFWTKCSPPAGASRLRRRGRRNYEEPAPRRRSRDQAAMEVAPSGQAVRQRRIVIPRRSGTGRIKTVSRNQGRFLSAPQGDFERVDRARVSELRATLGQKSAYGPTVRNEPPARPRAPSWKRYACSRRPSCPVSRSGYAGTFLRFAEGGRAFLGLARRQLKIGPSVPAPPQ